MHQMYREQARQEWTQARRKALWTQLRASLSHKKIHLIDFNELSHRFDLGSSFYRGVQPIPLDKIVGSVGRYQDFVQAFLPTNENMSERWQQVATAYLDPNNKGLPPIEACQVGEYYFVMDGNHRVSVARHLKLPEIEARVWEYFRPIAGLAPGVDIDTLLLEAERHDFLEKTRFDELVPGHTLRFTAPGGYTDVLRQIAHYQEILSVVDEVEIPYSQAVTAWYDMMFLTTVQLIEQTGVLNNFPKRTSADFFIWVMRHHGELEEHYSQTVMFETAVKDIKKEYPANRLGRLWQTVTGWFKRRSTS